MTLLKRISDESILWFTQSALLIILILMKTVQTANVFHPGPLTLAVFTALFPACFALGAFQLKRKDVRRNPDDERQGRFLMELVMLPVILACAFAPGGYSVFSGPVLCAALCWFAGCIFRRSLLMENADARRFVLPVLTGLIFGCLVFLIRPDVNALTLLSLLAAHFLLTAAVYFRDLRLHPFRCGIPVIFTVLLFGVTVWKLQAVLTETFGGENESRERPRFSLQGGDLLFSGRKRNDESGIQVFCRGVAVDLRQEAPETMPGDLLPLLATALQNENGKMPVRAAVVAMFASPLPYQLSVLPLTGQPDIFRLDLERVPFSRFPMIPDERISPDMLSEAARDYDLFFIDLPLPALPALNYAFTRNCFQNILDAMPPNGVLAVRIPRTGVPDADRTFAGIIQAAMPEPCVRINSPDCAYVIRRADNNAPVTDGRELAKRLTAQDNEKLSAAFAEPLQVVFPIWQKNTAGTQKYEVNTPTRPVLLDAVNPQKLPEFMQLLRQHVILIVSALLILYLLCRYFIGWKGSHKPAFQTFEAGFLASGAVAAVTLTEMYCGSTAAVAGIMICLMCLIHFRLLSPEKQPGILRIAFIGACWYFFCLFYPAGHFYVPLTLAGIMLASYALLRRRNMENLTARQNLLVLDSGFIGITAGLLYTAVFFDLHWNTAIPAAVPFLLLILLALFSDGLKNGETTVY